MADGKNGVVAGERRSAADDLRVRQIQHASNTIIPVLARVADEIRAKSAEANLAKREEGMILALIAVTCFRAKAGGIALADLQKELASMWNQVDIMETPQALT